MYARGAGVLLFVSMAVLACGSDRTVTVSVPGSTAARESGIDGTLDDWLAAVCKLGTWKPVGSLAEPGLIDSADCDSAADPQQLIAIWQFESQFTMRNTLSKMTKPFVYTSTSVQSDVRAFSVLTDTRDTSALEPLQAFGFTIEQGPIK